MNNEVNDKKGFNLWALLTVAAISGSTAASAGWVVGRAWLGDELEQYKKSESWKAPEAIEKMTSLSSKLNDQLTRITDYQELKQENKSLTSKNLKLVEEHKEHLIKLDGEKKVLEREVQELNQKVSELIADIENMKGEVIYVKLGEAAPVGHKLLRVGVHGISSFSPQAEIYAGTYRNTYMSVGESFTANIDSINYLVTMVKGLCCVIRGN